MAPTSKFLSTPSARRATVLLRPASQTSPISIHALREEGDQRAAQASRRSGHFYPRPPRGGRHKLNYAHAHVNAFLSTPSARRATYLDEVLPGDTHISIHALREEGDQCSHNSRFGTKKFLSTPSARRATVDTPAIDGNEIISIHALREEGDGTF